MEAWADHLPASLEQEFRASRSAHADASVSAKHRCQPARRRRQRRPCTTSVSRPNKQQQPTHMPRQTRFGGTAGHGTVPPVSLLPLAQSRTTRPRTSESGHCRSQRQPHRHIARSLYLSLGLPPDSPVDALDLPLGLPPRDDANVSTSLDPGDVSDVNVADMEETFMDTQVSSSASATVSGCVANASGSVGSTMVRFYRVGDVPALPATPREDGSFDTSRWAPRERRSRARLNKDDEMYRWLAKVSPSFPRRYMRAFYTNNPPVHTLTDLLRLGLSRPHAELEAVRGMRVAHAISIRAALRDLAVQRRNEAEREGRDRHRRRLQREIERARLEREWDGMLTEDALGLEYRARVKAMEIEAAARARAAAMSAAARARHERLWKGLTMAIFEALALKQQASSTLLQRIWRGSIGRRAAARVRRELFAAIQISSALRRHQAKLAVARRRRLFHHGALWFQRTWRGMKGRCEAAVQRRRAKALGLIQTTVRRLLGLRRVMRRRRRRLAAARRHKALEMQREAQCREEAALKLQSLQRGRSCRIMLAEEAAALFASKQQRGLRRVLANVHRRRRRRWKREARAAALLQARVRGMQQRQWYAKVLEQMRLLELEEKRLRAAQPKCMLGVWCPVQHKRCNRCGAGNFCQMRIEGGGTNWQYAKFVNTANSHELNSGMMDIEDLMRDVNIKK